MINSKFYNDYEGEGQIIFNDEANNKLIVWEGYIYVLMEQMFEQGSNILSDFYSREDDDNPWEIININNAINQFKSFNLSKIKQDGFSEYIPGLIREITLFLTNALQSNQKIYIITD